MSDFLGSMAVSSRLRADETKAVAGVTGLHRRVSSARPPIELTLDDSGFDLIAETKLSSPADGRLAPLGEATSLATSLATRLAGAGPAALSVLTEPTSFDGAIEHLGAVASISDLPVMRKDFLVDPIQVLEARASGASGVLLIARMLEEDLLGEMTDLAIELGMFVLVEIFELSDLDRATSTFDREILVGVNARDLQSLQVDRRRHEELLPHLPTHLPLVAESGIVTVDDVAAVSELGYRLALVGTSLVKSHDPEATTRSLIEAGRTAAGVRL
ncbi:MAG: indole-3-glycerol-phosphate synthase [Acidimicrobiia bacterium]